MIGEGMSISEIGSELGLKTSATKHCIFRAVRKMRAALLLRLNDAGLRVEEVPVSMEPRAGGDSKLRGRKAVKVIATVIGTLLAARFLRARRSS